MLNIVASLAWKLLLPFTWPGSFFLEMGGGEFACCARSTLHLILILLAPSLYCHSETLKYYTGYGSKDQEFRDMVKRLHLLHWEAGEKGKASWNKFRTKRWGEVALRVGVNEGELGF